MPTTCISVTCRGLDRLRCAAWSFRATRRAGTGAVRSLALVLGVILRGRAAVSLRAADADLYLALADRLLAPERVLLAFRARAALGAA